MKSRKTNSLLCSNLLFNMEGAVSAWGLIGSGSVQNQVMANIVKWYEHAIDPGGGRKASQLLAVTGLRPGGLQRSQTAVIMPVPLELSGYRKRVPCTSKSINVRSPCQRNMEGENWVNWLFNVAQIDWLDWSSGQRCMVWCKATALCFYLEYFCSVLYVNASISQVRRVPVCILRLVARTTRW